MQSARLKTLVGRAIRNLPIILPISIDAEPKTDAEFFQHFKERDGFYFHDPSKDVPTFVRSC